jgi:bifunctional NMN adenylyltransferase/nudix hydrolase
MRIGVVIGRFQVDKLTKGHLDLLGKVSCQSDLMVVLLGVPAFRTDRNPLGFQERVQVIRESFNAHVYPLLDNISNQVWSDNLDEFLKRTYPNAEFTLFHSRDSFAPHYKGKLPLKELATATSQSGTERRAEIGNYPPFDNYTYRLGYIAAYEHQRPTVRTAVDIALFAPNFFDEVNGEPQVLLIRKGDENGWRFPGGMIDPDETAEFAAKRELMEETGLEGNSWSYAGSLPIADWRTKGSKNGTLSLVFTATYSFGFPKGGDDAAEAAWFSWSTAREMLIADHKPTWTMLNQTRLRTS